VTAGVRDELTVIDKIRRSCVIKCLVNQESQLEVDSLSDRQRVELPQHWRDMITLTSASDESRCRVLHRLEAPEQTVCDDAEQRVTIVKMTTDKTLHERRVCVLLDSVTGNDSG